MVMPPIFMVLGSGVYLFSMIGGRMGEPAGRNHIRHAVIGNCWRMICGFDLLTGRLGLKLGLGCVVVGS